MNTLNTQKPSILASLLRIFIGAICCFGFVVQIIELINGADEPFEFRSIVTVLIGMVLVARGINGISLYKEDRPLPKSFSLFIWLLLGLPILYSLWTIFFAVFDIKESWPHLLGILPTIVAVMAISSVYEGRDDAFDLIKYYIIIYATGTIMYLFTFIFEPTLGNGLGLAFRLSVVSIALWYIYRSQTVKVVLPELSRSTSKTGKWLTFVSVGVISLFLILVIISKLIPSFGEDYDPSTMTEQYRNEDGYHTDGIVAFKIPSHYIIKDIEADGRTFFSITDSETEASEMITLVSELNYELTEEIFNEYFEGWKEDDFAYVSTSIVKNIESTLEGKHFRYRSVYFEDKGIYWDFAIVNQPDINKNCLISIYTYEPEKRVYFFIRSLKFI